MIWYEFAKLDKIHSYLLGLGFFYLYLVNEKSPYIVNNGLPLSKLPNVTTNLVAPSKQSEQLSFLQSNLRNES